MAFGYRGGILLSMFLIADAVLIWWVNTSYSPTGSTRVPVASDNVTLITYSLVGVAVIAILAAIFFKFKPVPAC